MAPVLATFFTETPLPCAAPYLPLEELRVYFRKAL
jgi:hypothetical protein